MPFWGHRVHVSYALSLRHLQYHRLGGASREALVLPRFVFEHDVTGPWFTARRDPPHNQCCPTRNSSRPQRSCSSQSIRLIPDTRLDSSQFSWEWRFCSSHCMLNSPISFQLMTVALYLGSRCCQKTRAVELRSMEDLHLVQIPLLPLGLMLCDPIRRWCLLGASSTRFVLDLDVKPFLWWIINNSLSNRPHRHRVYL